MSPSMLPMDPTPRRAWWMLDGNGACRVSFTPPCTEAEVRATYPAAALVLPDDDVPPEVIP